MVALFSPQFLSLSALLLILFFFLGFLATNPSRYFFFFLCFFYLAPSFTLSSPTLSRKLSLSPPSIFLFSLLALFSQPPPFFHQPSKLSPSNSAASLIHPNSLFPCPIVFSLSKPSPPPLFLYFRFPPLHEAPFFLFYPLRCYPSLPKPSALPSFVISFSFKSWPPSV